MDDEMALLNAATKRDAKTRAEDGPSYHMRERAGLQCVRRSGLAVVRGGPQ